MEGVGATYGVYLRLTGKLIGDFLLVIIELFSLGAFVLSQYMRLTDGRTNRWTDRQTDRISTAIPCVYASHSRTVKMGAKTLRLPKEKLIEVIIITSPLVLSLFVSPAYQFVCIMISSHNILAVTAVDECQEFDKVLIVINTN